VDFFATYSHNWFWCDIFGIKGAAGCVIEKMAVTLQREVVGADLP